MDYASRIAPVAWYFIGLIRQLPRVSAWALLSLWVSGVEGAAQLQLTQAERAWIKAHPVIEVGVCGNCPPIDFLARDGTYSGIAADFLHLAEQRLGLEFKATKSPDYQALVDNVVAGKYELIATVSEHSSRSDHLEFTASFFTDYQVIVTRRSEQQVYDSLDDLGGERVVVEPVSTTLQQLRKSHPRLIVQPVESILSALKAVSKGEAAACVGSDVVVHWLIQEHQLTNLRIVSEPEVGPLWLRFAVHRGPEWQPLVGLLNKVLDSVTEQERSAIRQRWLPIGIQMKRIGRRLQLTAEERNWLDRHPVLRLGVDPAWPPIEFMSEEGRYQGVTSEYIKIISEGLNLEIRPLQDVSWSEVITLAKRGEIDLLPAVGKTSERSTYLNFTEPYLTFPFVVYTRIGGPFVNGLEELRGKRVAVEDAYAFRAVIERDYPNLQLVLVENPLEGLRLLSRGEVDAYTGNLAVGSYLIEKEALSNLQVGAPTTYRFELRMGVRKDWPELVPILQKMLDELSDEEKMAIRQHWLGMQSKSELDHELLWRVSLGSFVSLFIAGLWLLQMRRQREALRRSEERHHLAMDAVSEAVWEWNLKTDSRYFSPGFFYHLGYQESEIPRTDREWESLIHAQDRGYVRFSIKRHIAPCGQDGHPLVLDFRVRHKQGGYVDVQSIGKVVEWDAQGKAVLRRGTMRDITAQKQVESELRKLSQAVEHSPSMVIITDIEGNIEYVNPKFTEVTGYTLSEVYGKNPRFLQSGLTDKALYKDLWETISAGKEWRGEIQDRKKNGEIFWESISISVVRNAEGKITHYVGVKEDITVRKEAERLLAVAKEEAEQANRCKSNFLANMSHEIRTPMNAIIGIAHLLLQTELNHQQYDYVNKIKKSTENLLGIINDILDFSMIEAGKLKIETTEFQLDQVLENLAEIVTLKAAEKGLEILFERDPKVPNVLVGDPMRLGQVLLNLVQNAVKFTEHGNVTARVELLRAQADLVEVAFTVSDTGIGLEAERIPGLFEAFVQIDSSSSRLYGGTGLGLSICKQLVALMLGELKVTSEPGVGSCFRFTLPLGRPADALKSGPATQVSDQRQQLMTERLHGKVLLVEDNPTNQLVARELLHNFGLQVRIAAEGGEALECLHREAFDLVLMDIQMPGMDGYAATRAIRAEKANEWLPIVAMTAHAMEGDEEKCLQAGMNGYLSKPVDPQRLYEILTRWLSGVCCKQAFTAKESSSDLSWPQQQLSDIDLSEGLKRLNGNRPLFMKLVRDFYQQQQDCCERITEALNQDDRQSAYRLAHTLQGVAGHIGCRKLESAAKELGVAIKGSTDHELARRLDRFCVVAGHVFVQLERCLAQSADLAVPATSSESQRGVSGSGNLKLDIIDSLSNLLHDGDPDVKGLMDNLQEAVDLSANGVEERMARLQSQVADYDYDQALITLQELTNIYRNTRKSDSRG